MRKKIYLLIASLILILVCIPRFNFYDPPIIKKFVERPNDAIQYINYTKYLSGESTLKDSIYKPYTYRILTPLIASKLPFDSLSSINLCNILFLLLSLLGLYHILLKLKFNHEFSFLGCLLFSFSFPTFYYSVTGLVDPAVIFFITLGVLVILYKKWILLSITMLMGILAKESIVVLFPFLIMILYYDKTIDLRKKYFIILFNIAIVLAVYFLLRALVKGNEGVDWFPSTTKFFSNIVRIRAFLGMVLTLGIPGIIVLWYVIKNHFKLDNTLENSFFVGYVTTLIVFIYSLFSAYSDGRFVWLSYPFSIPLALFFIENKMKVEKLKSFRK